MTLNYSAKKLNGIWGNNTDTERFKELIKEGLLTCIAAFQTKIALFLCLSKLPGFIHGQ